VSKILGQREQVPAKSLSAPIHSFRVSSCEGIVEIDVNDYGRTRVKSRPFQLPHGNSFTCQESRIQSVPRAAYCKTSRNAGMQITVIVSAKGGYGGVVTQSTSWKIDSGRYPAATVLKDCGPDYHVVGDERTAGKAGFDFHLRQRWSCVSLLHHRAAIFLLPRHRSSI
jgi:hypothetical protein